MWICNGLALSGYNPVSTSANVAQYLYRHMVSHDHNDTKSLWYHCDINARFHIPCFELSVWVQPIPLESISLQALPPVSCKSQLVTMVTEYKREVYDHFIRRPVFWEFAWGS